MCYVPGVAGSPGRTTRENLLGKIHYKAKKKKEDSLRIDIVLEVVCSTNERSQRG